MRGLEITLRALRLPLSPAGMPRGKRRPYGQPTSAPTPADLREGIRSAGAPRVDGAALHAGQVYASTDPPIPADVSLQIRSHAAAIRCVDLIPEVARWGTDRYPNLTVLALCSTPRSPAAASPLPDPPERDPAAEGKPSVGPLRAALLRSRARTPIGSGVPPTTAILDPALERETIRAALFLECHERPRSKTQADELGRHPVRGAAHANGTPFSGTARNTL